VPIGANHGLLFHNQIREELPTVHPESIRRDPWVTYASDASGVNRNYAQW
jgi:hypothetical protein